MNNIDIDNIEIKTDNTHKKVNKIELSGKKAVASLMLVGMTILSVIPFSGCNSLSYSKEIPTTGYEDTNKDLENTTKNTILNQSTTYYETTKAIQTQLTTNKSNIEETTKAQNSNYEKMLEQLNEVLEHKKIDAETSNLVRKTFDSIYKNYDEWKKVYKDLPEKEEYIKDKLINSLNYIGKITVLQYESLEAEKMREEKGYDTYTTSKNEIVFTSDGQTDIERFFHELMHVEQNIEENSLEDKKSYYYNGVNFSNILREGEATFHQAITQKMSEEKNQFSLIEDENGNIIYYGKATESGYADYLYIYNNLVYLIGYENLDNIKGKNVVEQIESHLQEKYGSDAAKEILDSIVEWIENKPTQTFEKSNKSYDSSIKLQKVFNKYILHEELSNIKTEKEINTFLQKYEKYKMIVLPKVINNEFEDITYEILGILEIDKQLEGKSEQILENEGR